MIQTARLWTSDIRLKPENGKKLHKNKGFDVSLGETAWWLADSLVHLVYLKQFQEIEERLISYMREV